MIKLQPRKALKIANYLARVVPAPNERAELLALIKELRGQKDDE